MQSDSNILGQWNEGIKITEIWLQLNLVSLQHPSIQWSLMDSFLHWHFNLASFWDPFNIWVSLFKNSRIINNSRLLNSKFKANCAHIKTHFCLSKIVEVKSEGKKSGFHIFLFWSYNILGKQNAVRKGNLDLKSEMGSLSFPQRLWLS